MRIGAGLTICMMLSGCLGQGFDGFTTENLTGRTFAGGASTVLNVGTSDGPVGSSTVAVAFDANNTARVQIGNSVSAMAFDAGFGGYLDSSGTIGMLVGTKIAGAKPTPDILYLSLFDGSSSIANKTLFLVVGNNTSPSLLPASGKATYTGRIFMVDGANQSSVGDLILQMNFPAAEISGHFSGALPADPSAVFTLVPAPVSGGNFSTSLTSPTVTVTDSAFTGSFFGTFGDQIGGTVVITSPQGNGAGQFGAAD